jgi:branched-chain amino acid transport system permease protein
LDSAALVQFLFSGLIQGGVYALIALGFMVIYNSSGIINFAQGELVMLGGMFSYTFYSAGVPLPVAIPAAVLLVTLLGVAFQHLAIRPLTARKAKPFSMIMVTIGASIFIRGAAMLVWGKDTFSLPYFLAGESIQVAGAYIMPHSLLVLGSAVLMMIALHIFFAYTHAGQAMRACAANPKGAALCGIRSESMVKLSFAISAALSSISGIIITPTNMTSYDVGIMLGLKGFVVAIIGGLNSFVGTIIGGFLLGIIEALGAGYISSQYKNAITFGVLILVLFIRPTGIFGRKN